MTDLTSKPSSQEISQALYYRQSQDCRTAKITELTETILLIITKNQIIKKVDSDG